ncbi:hypothetical protein [Butyrivibrio proteoclasticus]|uniref:hypothetical protein n=1 Tax=Butyrivibrio proteoclasticus TaxID=43305 RepID=UPI00047EBFF0|nr:hypothetical protein [Butyrivibrio proteoclasticus]
MKKKLMALLLATIVIASGCGAEDEPDEKDFEVSESEEESGEDIEDDNSVSDSDTEVSEDGIKLEGKYTDGRETWVFSGDEATYYEAGLEYTANFKIENDEFILDVDTVEMSEASIDYKKSRFKKSDDEIDSAISIFKKHWEDPEKIEYDEKNNTLTFGNSTYYYAENYDLGPNGVYTREDIDNITITFEDGELIFVDKDGKKSTFPYNCFLKNDEVYINFYNVDFWDSYFCEVYSHEPIKYVDANEIVFETFPENITFKK